MSRTHQHSNTGHKQNKLNNTPAVKSAENESLHEIKPAADAVDSRQAQILSMQGLVGNRITQRLIDEPANMTAVPVIQRVEGGSWVREHEAASRAAARGAAQGEKNVEGEVERYQGFSMTPDAEQLEKVLRAVIAEKGFKGAQNFVMNYGFRMGISRKQLDLREKIMPILRSKLDELWNKAKSYAEQTFYPAAVSYLHKILDDSQKMVLEEADQYGLHRGLSGEFAITENQDTRQMAAAAKEILETYQNLEQLIKKRQQYEEKEFVKEFYESGMRFGFRYTGEYNIRVTNPEAHAQVGEQIKAAQIDYLQMRGRHEAKFPVLASFRPPEGLQKLKDVAGGEHKQRSANVTEELIEKHKNIQEIREVADDGKFIWQQAAIIGGAKKALGVQPGSLEDKGIDAKASEVEMSIFRRKLGLGLLGLIGSLLTAIPTGGGSLAAYAAVGAGVGTAAAAGGISIYESIQEYQTQKAATGTTFDKAMAISQTEPSLFWLAVEIVGSVADIVEAASAFAKAAKAIRSLEKAATAEETARKAYRNAGLGGVMTEDQFVYHYLRNMREEMGLVGAAAKARTALMEQLASGTHPDMAALLAGSESAMVGLLKSHGRWEGLLVDLTADTATEEMQKIARHLVRYRKEEVISKLDEIFGTKQLQSAGDQPTSDLDFSIKSDESMGAGEKMMVAETYMVNKFGKGWEEMWRVNFYPDLQSRLLITEEVLPLMTENQKAGLLLAQHSLSNKLNLARQLHYAGSDPTAIARIEKEVADLGYNLADIRRLASAGEDAARLERNVLLLKIDEKEAAFRRATGQRKVELAAEIQQLQMEANFYTREAVISPGAAKELIQPGTAQGLQVADAIMEWKTLLQHNVAEYGGVGEAMRHYEAWKYIKRQVEFALRKDLEPGLKNHLELLKERGEYIYENRKWAEEASHLGGEAALEAKNIELYKEFMDQMTSISKEIHSKEVSANLWKMFTGR